MKHFLLPGIFVLLAALGGGACSKITVTNQQSSSVKGFHVALPKLVNPVPGYGVRSGGGTLTGSDVVLKSTIGEPAGGGSVLQGSKVQLRYGVIGTTAYED